MSLSSFQENHTGHQRAFYGEVLWHTSAVFSGPHPSDFLQKEFHPLFPGHREALLSHYVVMRQVHKRVSQHLWLFFFFLTYSALIPYCLF